MKWLLIALLLALSSTATAASKHHAPPPAPQHPGPITVGGVAVGQPLAIPECYFETQYLGYDRIKTTEYVPIGLPNYQDKRPCFMHGDYVTDESHIGKPPGPDEAVILDLKDSPVFAFRTIRAQLAGTVVEKISIPTNGTDDQDAAMRSLLQKYGKPTAMQTQDQATLMGARFQGIDASWSFDNLQVHFYGTLRRIDEGLITIETPASYAQFLKLATAAPASF